ncbi:hypothetical protein [Marinoscillum pacificum]|uniref:hypothetical protein n=1 Tax=Marinoscillum pacificum TaxID=392723 RepID=UPI0021589B2F|nr:hypothetical protein [Marinoscillum pacificum]
MYFLNIKLSRTIPIIGEVNAINFYDDNQLIYSCNVTRTTKRTGVFELYNSNNSLAATVKFTDNLRTEYTIQDHLNNELWEYHIPKSKVLISIAPEYCFLKSNSTEFKVLDQKDWKLILDNQDRIGRLTTEIEHPLKPAKWRITIDNNAFATLLSAFTLTIVIQHKVYLIYEPND